MPTIRASTTIDAPAATVFAYAADYRHATSLVQGLTKLEPVGKKTTGKGARFDAVFEIGHRHYDLDLAVTVYERNRAIGWGPVSGSGQSLVWRFEPVEGSPGSTMVTFEIGYETKGMKGLLSFTIDPILRGRARETAATLKRKVERG